MERLDAGLLRATRRRYAPAWASSKIPYMGLHVYKFTMITIQSTHQMSYLLASNIEELQTFLSNVPQLVFATAYILQSGIDKNHDTCNEA
jgi:hypothetical protein